jgi:hypothetical protein
MKQRKYEKLPMDAELRAQTSRVIEAYKNKKTKPKTKISLFNNGVLEHEYECESPPIKTEAPVREKWFDEVVPAMMKSIAGFIVAYDNYELSAAQQRKLFRMMKRIVARYPA